MVFLYGERPTIEFRVEGQVRRDVADFDDPFVSANKGRRGKIYSNRYISENKTLRIQYSMKLCTNS